MGPPYRLNSVQDIYRFTPLSKQFVPFPADRLVDFAKRKPIPVPPLLSLLPERAEVTVYTLKEEVRRRYSEIPATGELEETFDLLSELKGDLLTVTEHAPEKYSDMVSLLSREAEELDETISGKPFSGTSYQTTDKSSSSEESPTARFTVFSKLYALQTQFMKIFINTRDPRIITFFYNCLPRMLVYRKDNSRLDIGLLRKIKKLSSDSFELLDVFYELYSRKLSRFTNTLFSSIFSTFHLQSKDKFIKLDIPSNLKTNIITQLNTIHDLPTAKGAESQIETLLETYTSRLSTETKQQLKSITRNLFEKISTYYTFFDNLFSTHHLEEMHTFLSPFCVHEDIITKKVASDTVLHLYPCKDYHDLLKGNYSHDCTKGYTLAESHITNKRFLNVRIFKADTWVGNIYLLDYVKEAQTVVMDRIQISKLTKIIPTHFFPQFIDVICNRMFKNIDVRVIAPKKISNFKSVQKSFSRYTKNLNITSFTLEKPEHSFESYNYTDFYILKEMDHKRRQL